MKKTIILLILSSFTLPPIYAESDGSSLLDIHQIETLTGVKGELDETSHVFKVSAPREDLDVSAAGVKLTPGLGLTSWATFKTHDSIGEVVGELVLFEDQINLIMREALDNGLNITALHHQYLWDSPRIMVMQIQGEGPLKNLATTVGKIIEIIKKTSAYSIWMRPPPIIHSDKSTLNPAHIEQLLGKKGNLKNGAYKLTWGPETWAAFAGTDREAGVLGDIVMKEEEVQNVLKTLLKHNIYIVSLRQQQGEGNSKMMIVRYMGRGPAFKLAEMLKETIEQTTLSSAEKPQVE